MEAKKFYKIHIRRLARLIRQNLDYSKPMIGCEVGVWNGDTSVALLELFPTLSMIMIDRWEAYSESTKEESSIAQADQAQQLEWLRVTAERTLFAKNRRTIMVGDSVACSKLLQDHFLDFIFFDGGHDEQSVSNDLHAFHNKIKIGGLYTGHDYDGLGDRMGMFGVKKAVDRFFGPKVRIRKTAGNVWYKKL